MDAYDTDPSTHAAAAVKPAGRLARLVEAWFGRSGGELPAGEPFRDSDFEADSGFFGRPLGEH